MKVMEATKAKEAMEAMEAIIIIIINGLFNQWSTCRLCKHKALQVIIHWASPPPPHLPLISSSHLLLLHISSSSPPPLLILLVSAVFVQKSLAKRNSRVPVELIKCVINLVFLMVSYIVVVCNVLWEKSVLDRMFCSFEAEGEASPLAALRQSLQAASCQGLRVRHVWINHSQTGRLNFL